MANRVRLTVLAALAMLSVFTLCAGVAVAALMPARLALWQVPRVAAVRVAAPAAVLKPSVSSGTLPTRQGLASELAPTGTTTLSDTVLAVETVAFTAPK